MVDDRYLAFLEKILQRTKAKKINWYYLDDNRELYEGMQWTTREAPFGTLGEITMYPDFDTENSFYCRINFTYLVILVRYKKPASFYVIPDTFKKIVTLRAETYGNYITRLLNLVQSSFPDGEGFIDSILQDNED